MNVDRKTAMYMGLGFECVGLVMAGLYVGEFLDKKYGWSGTGTMASVMGALVLWFVHILLVNRQLTQDQKEDAQDPPA